jgi:hypothetical protein
MDENSAVHSKGKVKVEDDYYYSLLLGILFTWFGSVFGLVWLCIPIGCLSKF